MKTDSGSKGYSSTFAPRRWMELGGQRYSPATLPPEKRAGTHCTGRWVGPRVGVDGCGKSPLKSHLHRNSIPGSSIPMGVAIPNTLSVLPPTQVSFINP